MNMKALVIAGVFIVSWKAVGKRLIPCPFPSSNEWGTYDYSPNFEKEVALRSSLCYESFGEWKVRSFEKQKDVDAFMATKPAEGIEHLSISHIDDETKIKK